MWQHEAFKEKWGSRLVQRSVHKCQNQRGIHVQKLPVQGSWLHVKSRGSNKRGISVKMSQDRDLPHHGPVQDLAKNQSLSWRVFWSQFSLISTNMWHQVSLDLILDPNLVHIQKHWNDFAFSGIFQCEGRYDVKTCNYQSEHLINPYSSYEVGKKLRDLNFS